MRSTWHRAVFVGFVLVMSSLAGCIGTDDEDDKKEGQYGTVMVSTYHVGEIVKAIAGETVDVQMMSQNNIPVHDYSPALEDIVRLGDADLFLYHGLGLEPWVESTIEGLGSSAPEYAMVHTMPTGEISLDYETMLVDKLCDSLSSPSAEVIHMLAEHAEDAGELHGDDGAHNLGFPGDDHDDHDDHGDEDHGDEDHDDHDDHGDHDDHDHGDHEMLMPEDSLEASTDCPTGTVISVFHFEAGEYMLEFESEDVETFMMAIAAMGGAHHHHDHGDHDDHDDHGDEDDHDDHGDEDDHDDHGDEDDHDDHDDHDGHDDHDDHDEEMTPEAAMAEADTNNDSKLSWEEIESVMMDDDHDHDEHEEACHDTTTHETHDEYTNEADCEAAGHMWMEDHDEEGCHDTTTHETHDEYTNEADCEAAGHMWMEDHDDHGDEDEHDPLEEAMEEYMMGMMMDAFNESDEDGDSLLDIDELGHFIEDIDSMEEMDFPLGEIMITVFDEDGDDKLDFDEYMHFWGMEDDDHDHDNHTDDDHDNETHDDNETMEDMFNEMFQMMFNMSDTDGDGYLNSTELDGMMEEMMEEEHEEGVAFIGLHIEEEGEYGIALPEGVELHVLMAGGHEGHDHGSHDDHDDHAGHDDHDDHGDEDDHDDHGDEDDHDDHAEEELAYDPHSWLDPVAMAAQADIVLAKLIEVFPDGEDEFTKNANAFKAELVTLDDKFKSLTSTCADRTVAANHNAYSYLAYRYDIDFVTVHGLDPEGEPSAEDVVKVVDHINEEGITVLFVEEYTDQSSVQSIVDETGVDIQILYTMEMAPTDSSDDYLSLMNKNFESLEAGMTCSA